MISYYSKVYRRCRCFAQCIPVKASADWEQTLQRRIFLSAFCIRLGSHLFQRSSVLGALSTMYHLCIDCSMLSSRSISHIQSSQASKSITSLHSMQVYLTHSTYFKGWSLQSYQNRFLISVWWRVVMSTIKRFHLHRFSSGWPVSHFLSVPVTANSHINVLTCSNSATAWMQSLEKCGAITAVHSIAKFTLLIAGKTI